MLAFAWLGLAAVVGSLILIVDAALPGGPRLPDHSYVLPFALGLVAFGGTWFLLHDGQLRRVKLRRLWTALRGVPLPAAVGVLAVLVLLLLHRLARSRVVDDDYAANGFVDIAMYSGVLAAALAYGQYRLGARSDPPPSVRAHVAVYSICAAVLVAFAVASVATIPIHDDLALHRDVANRFANEPWVAHLVAASFEHGAYVYHLDTRDEAVLSAACLSLVPYDEAAMAPGFAAFAAQPTSLHYYNQGTDTFIRLCPSSPRPGDKPRPTPTVIHAGRTSTVHIGTAW